MSSAPTPAGPDAFRAAMRRLAGAVNIVTSASGDRRAGMTATAVCSVSADPPTILVCINRHAATRDVVVASGVFCVNILRAEDWELSTAFGGAMPAEQRFGSRHWSVEGTGAPVLADALCALDCCVVQTIEHATHSIFLGVVRFVSTGTAGMPLIYSSGTYARVAALETPHPLPEGSEGWGFW